jgi:transcriptional regulator GlxA family with amidase domain
VERGTILAEKEGNLSLRIAKQAAENRAMNAQSPIEPSQQAGRFRRIGFLAFPDCEILDVCGPLEAFFFADHWLTRLGKTEVPGYRPVIIADAPGPIRTMSGTEIVATHRYSEVSDGLDTLIVAGGFGVEQASKDEALVEWVRSMAPRARRVASICSGAFILAAAGLLDKRRVTTHWMFSNLLASTYPSIEVDASRLFVRDGHIYTSGGITAGIDLALALLEEDVGPEIMLAVARTMVVFPRRPGGQSQFCAHSSLLNDGYPFRPLTPTNKRPEFSDLQAWMLAHPEADLSVSALADRMGMSVRNFSRLFQIEVGETPAHFVERVRAEAARCKLEQTTSPVEMVAKECGFGDPERMRRTFQRLYDTSPADYRDRFRSALVM